MAEFDYSKASRGSSSELFVFVKFNERCQGESRSQFILQKLDEARYLANVERCAVSLKGFFYFRELIRLSHAAKMQSAVIRSKPDMYFAIFTVLPSFLEH